MERIIDSFIADARLEMPIKKSSVEVIKFYKSIIGLPKIIQAKYQSVGLDKKAAKYYAMQLRENFFKALKVPDLEFYDLQKLFKIVLEDSQNVYTKLILSDISKNGYYMKNLPNSFLEEKQNETTESPKKVYEALEIAVRDLKIAFKQEKHNSDIKTISAQIEDSKKAINIYTDKIKKKISERYDFSKENSAFNKQYSELQVESTNLCMDSAKDMNMILKLMDTKQKNNNDKKKIDKQIKTLTKKNNIRSEKIEKLAVMLAEKTANIKFIEWQEKICDQEINTLFNERNGFINAHIALINHHKESVLKFKIVKNKLKLNSKLLSKLANKNKTTKNEQEI